ncbi:MAG: N-acetylmuramoyl-L-alanine amidase [Clostridia bacterium]|nr:N-acetylmuramoyl-L-alanine amidase [Clostridia bacterium]
MRKLRLLMLLVTTMILMSLTVYADGTDISQTDIDEGIAFCKEYPVALQVDGQNVNAEVPPVIIKERTMIPARAVFESMGATVDWNEDARLVEVTMGSSEVQLTIDSSTAFVNGAQTTMEVPAMIIDERTLIPVRFVAESLDCGIDWNGDTRTVMITAPETQEKAAIDSVIIQDKSDHYRIVIQGSGAIENYNSFAYEDPERFGVDIKGAALAMEDNSIAADNDILSEVRFSQFDEETVRVVVDLEKKIAGKVSYSSEDNCVYIDFEKDQAENYEELGDVTADGLDVVDWRATEKLVIIDPGHGGVDSGSQGKIDGVVVLNERDINLDVATRLNRMLKAAGVSTYILRETDTTITLYERPTLANAANGDLYVSIHNNSSVNSSANGVEVYYNSKTTECDYGIYSKDLAEAVQANMVEALGLYDRGAKSEPAYAVLNKTQMPAIIIEGAFLSNAANLSLMQTDEFREQYALATAKAIIQTLNESVENQ